MGDVVQVAFRRPARVEQSHVESGADAVRQIIVGRLAGTGFDARVGERVAELVAEEAARSLRAVDDMMHLEVSISVPPGADGEAAMRATEAQLSALFVAHLTKLGDTARAEIMKAATFGVLLMVNADQL